MDFAQRIEVYKRLAEERDALDEKIELEVTALVLELGEAQDALLYARMAVKYHAALQRPLPPPKLLTEAQHAAALESLEKAAAKWATKLRRRSRKKS